MDLKVLVWKFRWERLLPGEEERKNGHKDEANVGRVVVRIPMAGFVDVNDQLQE